MKSTLNLVLCLFIAPLTVANEPTPATNNRRHFSYSLLAATAFTTLSALFFVKTCKDVLQTKPPSQLSQNKNQAPKQQLSQQLRASIFPFYFNVLLKKNVAYERQRQEQLRENTKNLSADTKQLEKERASLKVKNAELKKALERGELQLAARTQKVTSRTADQNVPQNLSQAYKLHWRPLFLYQANPWET